MQTKKLICERVSKMEFEFEVFSENEHSRLDQIMFHGTKETIGVAALQCHRFAPLSDALLAGRYLGWIILDRLF